MNGFVSAISTENKKVIDYQVLSKFCKGCLIREQKKGAKEYNSWKETHVCKINHYHQVLVQWNQLVQFQYFLLQSRNIICDIPIILVMEIVNLSKRLLIRNLMGIIRSQQN